MYVSLNGKLIKESRAHISIHDHGFLYGDGVYETLCVLGGQVLYFSEHLRRLSQSLRAISLKSPLSMGKIGETITSTLRANKQRDAAVRITVTRGPGLPGFDPATCVNPTILVTTRPFTGYPDRLYREGMTVALVRTRRNSPLSTPPSIKSTSCLNNVLATMEARKMKAQEALLLGMDGHLAEGAMSNVFVVKRGVIRTPAAKGRLLSGVTRDMVCRLARKLKLILRETPLASRDLWNADEIFLTNSLMGIMPVGRLLLGGRVRRFNVSEGASITQKLMICYTSPRRKSIRSRGTI